MDRKELVEKLIENKRDDLLEISEGCHGGEALGKVVGMIPYLKTKKIILNLLDDFEARTCESCKYSYKMYNVKKEHVAFGCNISPLSKMFDIPQGFGCNKWEQK